MKLLSKLAVILFTLASASFAQADLIEFELNYTLGRLSGDFGDGQAISDRAVFFPESPITLTVGDTLVFDVLFDRRLQVFDFGDSTTEVFTMLLDCGRSCEGVAFSGTWTSSVEALGARGDIWSDPITVSWQGGGGGFGWGGVGVNLTDTQGSFSGIRWTTTFTSIREGDPLTVSAFSGFSGRADGFRFLPLPEPSTFALLCIGLAGMGLVRRRERAV